MFPYLYQSNVLNVGSYGVMLATAYLVGRYLYLNRLSKVVKGPINTEILIISLLVFGLLGAKLMFVIKNPEQASFMDWDILMSGSGFSSQGALLAAIAVTLVFSRLSKIKLNLLLDSAAPAAVLAYAIARVGCFLAGDDCYGIDSNLPWAMSFPNGVAKTRIDQHVHPLPIYEVLYSVIIWKYLDSLQRKELRPYFVFFNLLLLWGLCRFLIEFISTNPIKLLGMSGSQFGALVMFLSAVTFFTWQKVMPNKKKPVKITG